MVAGSTVEPTSFPRLAWRLLSLGHGVILILALAGFQLHAIVAAEPAPPTAAERLRALDLQPEPPGEPEQPIDIVVCSSRDFRFFQASNPGSTVYIQTKGVTSPETAARINALVESGQAERIYQDECEFE